VPRRVWSAVALQTAGRFWGTACTLVYLWLAAQALGGSEFGRLTFYLAVFAWLDSLANMGTGQVAVQLTAGEPERIGAVLATARRVRLAAGLIGVALVGGGALAARESGAAWILLASLYPVTHALELSATVFRNRIAWGVPVLMRTIASGLSLAAVLVLYLNDVQSPAQYLFAIAAGSATANFLLHAASRRHLPRERSRPEPMGAFLRAAVPLGISGLLAQTYFYIDNLFVLALCGEEPLGHYNVAVRVLSASIMLAQYASLAALPWFTRCHQQGTLGPAIARLTAPLFAFSGLMCGLVWPWAERLLDLFEPGFGAAADALRWLLLATLAIYVGALLLTGVVAIGDSRSMLWIAATGLAVNIGLNAWLVPAYGIEGAGAATLATETSVTLGAWWALRRAGIHPSGRGASWRWFGGPALFGAGLVGSRWAAPALAALLGLA
jgi:O-antigen/teichoic acid export membrane protein